MCLRCVPLRSGSSQVRSSSARRRSPKKLILQPQTHLSSSVSNQTLPPPLHKSSAPVNLNETMQSSVFSTSQSRHIVRRVKPNFQQMASDAMRVSDDVEFAKLRGSLSTKLKCLAQGHRDNSCWLRGFCHIHNLAAHLAPSVMFRYLQPI